MIRKGRGGASWLLATGVTLLLALVLASALAPLLSPLDPNHVRLDARLQAPSRGAPLGTDSLGRCILARVLWGGRVSLGGALLVSLGAIGLGGLVGTLGAIGGRRVDLVARATTDVGLAIPGIALALIVSAAIGPGLLGLILGLALALAPWWARFVHDLTRVALSKEYVTAGRVVGVRGVRLYSLYVLPQVAPLVLVAAAWRTGLVLGALAGLSYLGLGAQPPAAEWGAMVREGRVHMDVSLWPILGPGLAVTLAVGACVMLAEGLKDRFHLPAAVEDED